MSALDLSGVEFPDWPEGYTPIEGAVIVKALDPDAVVRLVVRYSSGITSWEALGMLEACALTVRGDLADAFYCDDDGEGDGS